MYSTCTCRIFQNGYHYFINPALTLPLSLPSLGKPMKLSESAEEAATFFAKMLDHDYTSKDVFCNNFFADWRKVREHIILLHVHVHVIIH